MIIYEDSLAHHGIKGQKWGERNGPPYPLSRVSTDISEQNYNRINELYRSMSYEDRKFIDPDSTEEPQDYFKNLDFYKKNIAYNAVSNEGFLVAETIPDDYNVPGTHGVEIGIGVVKKNQGVGTKMVGDLVDWFNKQNDIDVLWWPVDERNKASIRIAEKNGFIKDPLGDNYLYAKDSALDNLGITRDELYLEHHGIKGMKWGIRKYQNPDGSLTPEGRKRYAQKNLKHAKVRNLDKWGMDENHNVLYIIGASGSGKSTTARGLANDNDSIIHLDTLFENTERGTVSTRNKDFELYCMRKGIDVKKARDSSASVTDRRAVIRDISNQVEPYGKQCYDKGRRVIVEGVQMADDTMFADKRYFKDKATITLHTSKMRSAIRAATRDKKNAKDIFTDFTDKERADWYDYVNDRLKVIDNID